MKLSPQELAVINFSIQQNEKNEAIQYQLSELPTAIEVMKKLKQCISKTEIDGKEVEVFTESEIELTSEESVFIKNKLNRSRDIEAGTVALTLSEKLK